MTAITDDLLRLPQTTSAPIHWLSGWCWLSRDQPVNYCQVAAICTSQCSERRDIPNVSWSLKWVALDHCDAFFSEFCHSDKAFCCHSESGAGILLDDLSLHRMAHYSDRVSLGLTICSQRTAPYFPFMKKDVYQEVWSAPPTDHTIHTIVVDKMIVTVFT